MLKDQFPDGVLWFRADLKKMEDILDEILLYLGCDLKTLSHTQTKLRRLISLSERRQYLIILDNINIHLTSSIIIKELINLKIPLLFTSIQPIFDESKIIQKQIVSFTSEEFYELASNILGKPYVIQNKTDLNKIGNLLGRLPISSVIILKQILTNPLKIKNYGKELKHNEIQLDKMSYDNKNLFSSFEISYKNLNLITRKVLVYCSIFDGADFSIDALGNITDLPISSIQKIIDRLVALSLIEFSVKNRYRLHPAVKIFLRSKLDLNKVVVKATTYYIDSIKTIRKNIEVFFNQEIENIAGIMDICFDLKLYKEFIDLWSQIKTDLWFFGKWNYIILLKNKIQSSYEALKDTVGLVNFLGEDLPRIYFYLNNQKQLLRYLKIAMKQAKLSRNDVLIGLVTQKFGFVYLNSKKYELAREKLQESIDLLTPNGPKRDLIKSYIYIGNTYMHLEDIHNGFKYLESALQKSKDYKIVEDIGLSYIFLGYLYLKTKKFLIAEEYFNKGVKIENKINRKVVIAMGYEGLADLNDHLGRYLRALDYYKIVLDLYTNLNMKKEIKTINKKIQVTSYQLKKAK